MNPILDNPAIRNILIQIAIYVAMFTIMFVLLNLATMGFLRIYVKVKSSRGKLVLIRIESVTGTYYRAGKQKEPGIQYKMRGSKEIETIPLKNRLGIVREMGVNVIHWNEMTKMIITPEGSDIEGHNTEHIDGIYKRCLYRPVLGDNKMIILIILVVVIALVSMYTAYSVNKLPSQINLIVRTAINQSAVGIIQ